MVAVAVANDLSAQEAVFGCDVAFDVADEARYPCGVLVGEHQRGQATMKMIRW